MWRATNPTAPWRSWHGRFHPFVSGIYRLYKVIRELSIRSERFTTLEFEGHSSAGVNGHCVDNGQPEFFVKLVDGVQLLHLEHESSDGFCLGFPCSFCSAELFEPCLGFFIPLYKPIVPGGVFFLVLCRLRILRNAAFFQFGYHIDLLKQGLHWRQIGAGLSHQGEGHSFYTGSRDHSRTGGGKASRFLSPEGTKTHGTADAVAVRNDGTGGEISL